MVQPVQTGPKIAYGFVTKKFQKGNFLGHSVYSLGMSLDFHIVKYKKNSDLLKVKEW